MPSTFIEKHKRKSALALLLLLLKWRKGLIPLLLLVVILIFTFVPGNFLGIGLDFLRRVPGGAYLADGIARVGAELRFGRDSDKPYFHQLLEGFRAARADKAAGWGAFFGGPAGLRPGSSVDMVKGSREDLSQDGSGLSSKIKGGASVAGIAHPEETEKTSAGVELSAEDLTGERAGLVDSAYAEGAGPSPMSLPSGQTAALGGVGAFASKAFFSAGPVPYSADRKQSALSDTKVPLASSLKVQAERGKLSPKDIAAARTANRRGGNLVPVRKGSKAFAQLADGRVRSMMARDPICTASNGCPPEYAATNTAAVFDGVKVGPGAGQIITSETAPQVNGIETPNANIPSEGQLQAYDDEAKQLMEDAEKCRQANEKYLGTKEKPGPETREMQTIQQLSNQMRSMNCSGGCRNRGRMAACQAMGNRMTQSCNRLNSIMYQHYMECPLMQKDGPYRPQAC